MRMKKVLVIACIAAVALQAAASPLSRIYSADDELYRHIELLSIAAGIVPPSSASPWSGYELAMHLERIDHRALTQQGRSLYEASTDALHLWNKPYPHKARISLTPEIYLNVNGHEQMTYRDWGYDVSYRRPFAYLEAEAVLGERFYSVFSAEARKEVKHMLPDPGEQNLGFGSFSSNIVFSPEYVEYAFPYKAFAGTATDSLTFLAGRDTLSWGRGNTGNLFIGDHAPYHDFISFRAYGDVISYRFLTMQFDELDKLGRSREFHISEQNLRLFVAHRLEAQLSPRFAAAVTEGALFYTSRLDLRLVSPVMLMHNFMNYDELKNFFHFDIDYILAPGLLAYGQFFLDQYQLPVEVEKYREGDILPNAFGLLGGIQLAKPAGAGYITGYAEAVLTSTYLYLRRNIGEDDDINTKHYTTDHWNLDLVQGTNIGGVRGTSFLGYRWGPDSVFTAVQIGYEVPRRFSIHGEVLFGIQGEQGLLVEGKTQLVPTGKEHLNQIFPSGTVEYRLTGGVSGELNLRGVPAVLYGKVHAVNRWFVRENQREHVLDLQVSAGAQVSLHVF